MQEEEEAGKCIWVKDWLNFSNLLQIQMFILPFTKPKVPMNYSSNQTCFVHILTIEPAGHDLDPGLADGGKPWNLPSLPTRSLKVQVAGFSAR